MINNNIQHSALKKILKLDKMSKEISKVITVDNAGYCTAYELRQELVRRKALDIEESNINFRTMLQRLMIELVKEDNRKQDNCVEKAVIDMQVQREKAKAEREEKKRIALEKSRERQLADPEYFKKRAEENVAAAMKKEAEVASSASSMADHVDAETDDNGMDVIMPNDPFRSYATKSRSKIFVK